MGAVGAASSRRKAEEAVAEWILRPTAEAAVAGWILRPTAEAAVAGTILHRREGAAGVGPTWSPPYEAGSTPA